MVGIGTRHKTPVLFSANGNVGIMYILIVLSILVSPIAMRLCFHSPCLINRVELLALKAILLFTTGCKQQDGANQNNIFHNIDFNTKLHIPS